VVLFNKSRYLPIVYVEYKIMKKPVTYIIGVHGIGEQRKNENILPIINGFARVRQAEYNATKGDKKINHGFCPLTQGMLSSQQATTPWIEFAGISSNSVNPEDKNFQPFIGNTVDENDLGDNFRFVDLHWADIMQSHFDIAGQNVESWTQALIDRLKLRGLDNDQQYGWIPELLNSMRRGVLPIKHLLDLKQRLFTGTPNQLNDTAFNRFLGDAQLYGEYRTTRDQAVFRFHKTLAKVHAAHCAEQERNPNLGEPRYIILGHSLGTIMSFDALLYAHGANKLSEDDSGNITLDLAQLDLRMYCDINESQQGENLPDLSWIKHVDTFISLGSPIDKYLILWWANYKHLINSDWLDNDLTAYRETHKIQHYNYCDEQDPVGHELDTAYTADVVNQLFDIKEDVVFMRYGTPGVAHIKYWNDIPLLSHIVNVAIDQERQEPNKADLITQRMKEAKAAEFVESVENVSVAVNDEKKQQTPTKLPKAKETTLAWFKPSAYMSTLFWSYGAIPLLGLGLASLFFMLWYYNIHFPTNNNYIAGGLALLASVVVFIIMLRNMSLMIQWRQLMREARENSHERKPHQSNHKEEACNDEISEEDNPIKNKMVLGIRIIIFASPFVWFLFIMAYHYFLSLDLRHFWITYLYVLSVGAFILSTLNMYWFIKMKWLLAPEKLLPDCLDSSVMALSKYMPQLKFLVGVKKKKKMGAYFPEYIPKKYSLDFHDYICCKDQARSSDKKPKGCGKCKGNGRNHEKGAVKAG